MSGYSQDDLQMLSEHIGSKKPKLESKRSYSISPLSSSPGFGGSLVIYLIDNIKRIPKIIHTTRIIKKSFIHSPCCSLHSYCWLNMVGAPGFEPGISGPPDQRVNQTSLRSDGLNQRGVTFLNRRTLCLLPHAGHFSPSLTKARSQASHHPPFLLGSSFFSLFES